MHLTLRLPIHNVFVLTKCYYATVSVWMLHCFECIKCACVLYYVIEPATQYVVSVRAFNDIDKGPVIYDLVYTASNQGVSYVLSHTLARLLPSPLNVSDFYLAQGYVFA